MIHLVCLTKPYNELDFKIWYKWHRALNIDRIHVFHNDSDLQIEKLILQPDTYHNIKGWPNQWQLYNDILNNNEFGFNKKEHFKSFEEVRQYI